MGLPAPEGRSYCGKGATLSARTDVRAHVLHTSEADTGIGANVHHDRFSLRRPQESAILAMQRGEIAPFLGLIEPRRSAERSASFAIRLSLPASLPHLIGSQPFLIGNRDSVSPQRLLTSIQFSAAIPVLFSAEFYWRFPQKTVSVTTFSAVCNWSVGNVAYSQPPISVP